MKWPGIRCSFCAIIAFAFFSCSLWLYKMRNHPDIRNFFAGDIIDFSGADNVTGFSHPIIPNIVHMVHFGKPELEFVEAVSLKAAHSHQKPERIIIHCDCYTLKGKYWNMVKNISGLEVQFMQQPQHIFGKRLSSIYHASDIARLELMMTFGGIYIDSDVYIVSSLDEYRKFEFSLGWPPKQYLGTQILVAHKNSRFLKLWYHSYKYYQPNRWYYNAGELPTQSILMVKPSLVHRVERDFGVQDLTQMLYSGRTDEWKTFKAIHLLFRHKKYLVPGDTIANLDEQNIKLYDRTFGDMARLVLYGTTELIGNNNSSKSDIKFR